MSHIDPPACLLAFGGESNGAVSFGVAYADVHLRGLLDHSRVFDERLDAFYSVFLGFEHLVDVSVDGFDFGDVVGVSC